MGRVHAEAGLGVGIRCHQIPGVVHLPVDEVGDVPAEARPATLPSRAALGQVVCLQGALSGDPLLHVSFTPAGKGGSSSPLGSSHGEAGL